MPGKLYSEANNQPLSPYPQGQEPSTIKENYIDLFSSGKILIEICRLISKDVFDFQRMTKDINSECEKIRSTSEKVTEGKITLNNIQQKFFKIRVEKLKEKAKIELVKIDHLKLKISVQKEKMNEVVDEILNSIKKISDKKALGIGKNICNVENCFLNVLKFLNKIDMMSEDDGKLEETLGLLDSLIDGYTASFSSNYQQDQSAQGALGIVNEETK